MNWWVYGKFVGVDIKETNFQRALAALHSVRSGGTKPHVPITKEAMSRVFEVSPTFKSLAPYFEGVGKNWEDFGCTYYQELAVRLLRVGLCGRFAMRFNQFGYYNSPKAASQFFGQLADEIEEACVKGQLQCSPQLIADMPPGHGNN